LSVAVSTAPWAAILLFLGAHFGRRVIHLFGAHPWAYLIFPAAVVATLAASAVDLWWHQRREAGHR
ncbi:MAG: hypothetical protein ACREQM_20995, partial [Candidatus Dormibacteraceae bacterium]